MAQKPIAVVKLAIEQASSQAQIDGLVAIVAAYVGALGAPDVLAIRTAIHGVRAHFSTLTDAAVVGMQAPADIAYDGTDVQVYNLRALALKRLLELRNERPIVWNGNGSQDFFTALKAVSEAADADAVRLALWRHEAVNGLNLLNAAGGVHALQGHPHDSDRLPTGGHILGQADNVTPLTIQASIREKYKALRNELVAKIKHWIDNAATPQQVNDAAALVAGGVVVFLQATHIAGIDDAYLTFLAGDVPGLPGQTAVSLDYEIINAAKAKVAGIQKATLDKFKNLPVAELIALYEMDPAATRQAFAVAGGKYTLDAGLQAYFNPPALPAPAGGAVAAAPAAAAPAPVAVAVPGDQALAGLKKQLAQFIIKKAIEGKNPPIDCLTIAEAANADEIRTAIVALAKDELKVGDPAAAGFARSLSDGKQNDTVLTKEAAEAIRRDAALTVMLSIVHKTDAKNVGALQKIAEAKFGAATPDPNANAFRSLLKNEAKNIGNTTAKLEKNLDDNKGNNDFLTQEATETLRRSITEKTVELKLLSGASEELLRKISKAGRNTDGIRSLIVDSKLVGDPATADSLAKLIKEDKNQAFLSNDAAMRLQNLARHKLYGYSETCASHKDDERQDWRQNRSKLATEHLIYGSRFTLDESEKKLGAKEHKTAEDTLVELAGKGDVTAFAFEQVAKQVLGNVDCKHGRTEKNYSIHEAKTADGSTTTRTQREHGTSYEVRSKEPRQKQYESVAKMKAEEIRTEMRLTWGLEPNAVETAEQKAQIRVALEEYPIFLETTKPDTHHDRQLCVKAFEAAGFKSTTSAADAVHVVLGKPGGRP